MCAVVQAYKSIHNQKAYNKSNTWILFVAMGKYCLVFLFSSENFKLMIQWLLLVFNSSFLHAADSSSHLVCVFDFRFFFFSFVFIFDCICFCVLCLWFKKKCFCLFLSCRLYERPAVVFWWFQRKPLEP